MGLWAHRSMGLQTVAAGWFPWGSPLLFSGGVAVGLALVLPGFPCCGGPLDVCGLDLLRVSLRSRGAGLWLLTLAIAYLFMEKPYLQERAHTYTHRCLDSGLNRYTDVLH
ncbi:hypothetical protein ILYODFUR_034110 [Ilyodon furcidens]|uniref:Uncharacterized protein n=1 Tax=Ilyodon furcidens TaxID=33524 RepID=A0ABV0U2Z0_9TELE